MNNKLVKLNWSTQNIAWHWVEGMSMYTSHGDDIVDRDHLMNCIERNDVYIKEQADDITYVMNGDYIRDIKIKNLSLCHRAGSIMVAIVSDKGQVTHTTLEKDEMNRLAISYLAAFNPDSLNYDS